LSLCVRFKHFCFEFYDLFIVPLHFPGLKTYKLSAKLIYDEEDTQEQKEVVVVKSPPLEFRAHLDNSGTRGSMELRIKVLTSQHEDMLFRVVITAVDSIGKETLQLLTEPIKVVSKITGASKPKSIFPKKKKQNKKRSHPVDSDAIVTKLKELEDQQMQQKELIQKLSEKKEDEPGTDFETVFLRLVEIYHASSCQDRPEKIRKVLTLPGPSQVYIRELLSSFLTQATLLDQQQQVDSSAFGSALFGSLYADFLTMDAPNLSALPQQ